MNNLEELELSIENNLYKSFAKNFEHARIQEIYTAVASSVRQIVGEKWFHSLYDNLKAKRLYILSFEYTFGDNLFNHLIKLNIYDDLAKILSKHNIDIQDVIEQDLEFALGFGDLGYVSGYLLEYLASHHKNVYAYGLRYRKGMLKQEIINGEQIEKPDDWRVNNNPWEHEKGFSHVVNFKNDSVKAIPYDIPVMGREADVVNTLRLWKSFSMNDLDFNSFSKGKIQKAYEEINRANSIVEFLYPSESNQEGRKLRLTQEYFFVDASIQDIFKKYKKYVGEDISKIHEYIQIQINDIHPTLAVLCFINHLINKFDYTFSDALDLAKKVFIYMQLSILPETYETWEIGLISDVCPNLLDIIYNLDKYVKNELSNSHADNASDFLIIHEGKVDFVNILYYVCKNIVTISQNHLNLLEKRFLSNKFRFYRDKIKYVNIDFDSKLYYKQRMILKNKTLDESNSKDINLLENIKYQNKLNLLDKIKVDARLINPKSAFIMHLGNFHEYKRQILSALSVALNYMRLKKNPNLDIPERTYFFAGKSYPNYYMAKEAIKFINALAKLINNDLFIKDKLKVVFIENYNLTVSNLAIPASDIFLDLELLNLESNNYSSQKAISSLSAVMQSNSTYEYSCFNQENIDVYTFGESINSILNNYGYNIYEFLENNKELKQLFDFFRNLSSEEFPFDINIIYNGLYYFNDHNHVLKDLLEFDLKMEEVIKEYSENISWMQDRLKNTEKLLKSNKDDLSSYFEILE